MYIYISRQNHTDRVLINTTEAEQNSKTKKTIFKYIYILLMV